MTKKTQANQAELEKLAKKMAKEMIAEQKVEQKQDEIQKQKIQNLADEFVEEMRWEQVSSHKNKQNKSNTGLIIGIIIGVILVLLCFWLRPRAQGAQGMARDVSRKNSLSQIQVAVVAYQSQTGKRPQQSKATQNAISTDEIKKEVIDLGLITSIPTDINKDSQVSGLWNATIRWWNFAYMISKRGQGEGFILMAKMETPTQANRSIGPNGQGSIPAWTDISTIYLCDYLIQVNTSPRYWAGCEYKDPSELRYISLY